MSEDDYNMVVKLFYEMYQPHTHEVVCGYNDETTEGKEIVVFQNRLSKRQTHVYLSKDKKRLMPFFPPF